MNEWVNEVSVGPWHSMGIGEVSDSNCSVRKKMPWLSMFESVENYLWVFTCDDG